MSNQLFIIAIVSLFLLGLVLISLIFLAIQFLKYKTHMQKLENKYHSDHQSIGSTHQLSEYKEYVPEPKSFCKNHPQIPAIGVCNICEEAFCINCIKTHKNLQLCLAHLEVFLTSNWIEIVSVLTTPNEPEKGLFLYNFKRDLWKNESIPTYVQTQYKINVENDLIESCVVLFGQEEKAEELRDKLKATNQ